MKAEDREGDEVKERGPKHGKPGGITRVDTIVAMEFAASCNPFKKSKIRAKAIRPINAAWD